MDLGLLVVSVDSLSIYTSGQVEKIAASNGNGTSVSVDCFSGAYHFLTKG